MKNEILFAVVYKDYGLVNMWGVGSPETLIEQTKVPGEQSLVNYVISRDMICDVTRDVNTANMCVVDSCECVSTLRLEEWLVDLCSLMLVMWAVEPNWLEKK